jgi:hypothetical protein
MQSKALNEQHRERTEKLVVGDVFHEGKSVFVAITSGAQGTTVYADGAVVEMSRTFRISSNEFTGRLVVANNVGWSGQPRPRNLRSRTVAGGDPREHYKKWTRNERPKPTANENPIALYLFDERRGNVVHNQIDSTTDLLIPEHYFVLHPAFLLPPWEEFRPGWSYWKDVIINIAGFIPLGFCFCAYLVSVRKTKPRMMSAVILGFTVSLTIEVLQGFLPTRSSGTTDILTNTFGTGLGVMLCNCRLTQSLVWNRVNRLPLSGLRWEQRIGD